MEKPGSSARSMPDLLRAIFLSVIATTPHLNIVLTKHTLLNPNLAALPLRKSTSL